MTFNPRIVSPHGQRGDCFDTVRMGARAAVVSNHPVATSVGITILANGGNAVDAAVAVGFAIGVAEPNGSGIGGDGYLMVHHAASRSVHVVNGTGASPLAARPEHGLDRFGIRSASVPGMVDAMLEAHARWGRLSLMDCIAPAIALCLDGVPVSYFQADMTRKYDRLHSDPEAAKIFAPNGHPLKAGAIRRNADLAQTYRQIATHGRDYFYNGPVADAIDRFSAAANGLLRREDMARHRVRVEAPITTTYRGKHVYEAGPNSSGHLLLQQLSMLEQFDIGAMDYLSPEAVHLMVEAKRLAYIDREAFLSDPDDTDIPLAGLLSKSYAAERAALIRPDAAAASVAPGDPWQHDASSAAARQAPSSFKVLNAREDTTHFCVVDSDGNAVSQLQSLNMMFGSQAVVPGTGIILNNRMTYWHLDPSHPNYLRPGARTRHTMNPVMVFDDRAESGGPLRWVLGTPGGDTQVQTNFQVISALVDHGLNEAEAAQAPRWCHEQDGTYSNHPHAVDEQLTIEQRYGDTSLVEGLAARGHDVEGIGAWKARGSLAIIGVDPESGARLAAVDLRRDGQAQAM
ncbi:gamma-glutamyltransferase [Paraburkholderia sp.]|uniref:gamma-glutamyltransferase n=1 Tax=Paraburkholderia sp. TaxID=1926495 RepID=UPI00239157FD|nr:gamma-glutamyltransferase [Paraburkholderia sp.]MDE1179989.1 gamma-glutamyltransferase [Paraburkholderia sp.]